ncbi:E3 ubiquitin-protein ligase HOS1-like isoform X1 [Papaver somniferum]|uniref:E3 ubiquitin-protein ligase HOS1-like isoform X1 n=2 Tax=Papaver somniferum TaxID=3469 RepID=UPI000E7008D3|nr:E3 ubiquitin-protein ligase HOS1-like isoform X1 [Papaver somniferum]
MERTLDSTTNGVGGGSPSPSRLSSFKIPPLVQPDYSSRPVQEALEHLATIDLIELSNEAKVERCRATRDLRSCGRYVRHVLNSCGHASLCSECSQRCDVCPICRTSIPKTENLLRVRLFYECIEAGLISKRFDDRFQEKEDGEKELTTDVQRLYCLFDVAMENNLVSLICHYVTDVCMDESAVSSDPVIAFLVDEVAVKDWCKRTFGNIISNLQAIYTLQVEEMKKKLPLLSKFLSQLTGISNVIEVLESSIKGTLYAQQDLHNLQENVLKAKQHLEIIKWSIKRQFLENVRSRHINYSSWRSRFRDRKSAAITRAWPEFKSNSAEYAKQDSATLFIEDALSNLGIEQETSKELEVLSLVKNGSSSSFIRSNIEGFEGCYPFETLRDAADVLFLCGSSDVVVAKRAIFLYYLFDRHWTKPDKEWRHIIDDFAASFGITRDLMLESLTFYLLDDNTDQALQEACKLLPEIAGPNTHPKIAQVMLERQNPDGALMVLRWSGRDGGAQLVSLRETVIAVRVRVECGLLTEAFMYQRTHCLRVKEEKVKRGTSSQALLNDVKVKEDTWLDQMDSLITEICCLCIRRNLIDKMIELPWNSDEEKCIHKCLLEYATEYPESTSGSLLVVYYLQRFRYIEAYQVDQKLQSLEQDIISKASNGEEAVSKIRSISQWRAGLVDKCIDLLPDVQQQQVKLGNFPDFGVFSSSKEDGSKSDMSEEQPPNSSLLHPFPSDSSVLLGLSSAKKGSAFDTPAKPTGSIINSHIDLSNYRSPSIVKGRFLTPVGGSSNSHSKGSLFSKHASASREVKYPSGIKSTFKLDDISTPGTIYLTPDSSTPLKEANRISPMVHAVEYTRPSYLHSIPEPLISTPINNHGFLRDTLQDSSSTGSGKRVSSERPWMSAARDESMDFTWSQAKKNSPVKDLKGIVGSRWRSDEDNEDEQPSAEKIISRGLASIPLRRERRCRSTRI